MRVDALQYCAWDRTVFEQMRGGGVDVVHATVAYHEDFRALAANLTDWDHRARANADLIALARDWAGVEGIVASGRTAILLGAQTPSVIDADLGLIALTRRMGLVAMQPTYNRQSLLGSGWQEPADGGLTAMGREAVAEMNRVGMLVDLSHAGARTAMEAVQASARPVAITHANPRRWRDTARNVTDELIETVTGAGGMLGFSLYPHHLTGGSDCTLAAFCRMVADYARRFGTAHFGIGSDLCQGQPDAVVDWMRRGRLTLAETPPATFPPQPTWFRDNRDWDGIAAGLRAAGLTGAEVAGILGDNWARFLRDALSPG
ncbi:MAG: membrane dipeptidase [Paracoccaceae bacterium]